MLRNDVDVEIDLSLRCHFRSADRRRVRPEVAMSRSQERQHRCHRSKTGLSARRWKRDGNDRVQPGERCGSAKPAETGMI
jgi:hypothetical protein